MALSVALKRSLGGVKGVAVSEPPPLSRLDLALVLGACLSCVLWPLWLQVFGSIV